MMAVKPWCDHAEGFGAWELDVGDRPSGTALADVVKHTVMMTMAPFS